MSEMPYIRKNADGSVNLIVDGELFPALGGEFHNSDGSDPEFLDERVWPAVKEIGGTCYLTPVYWEQMERVKGSYDFSLVDAALKGAQKAGVRLALLWFGLWKNGKSQYIPGWMKTDSSYFYIQDEHGVLRESVSPFCKEAVSLDRKAFTALAEHLRDVDHHTVIMLQVENEVGIWGELQRDYSDEAQRLFEAEIPEDLKNLYGTSGSWTDAFGAKASEYFMAYGYASAVEQIASAGKDIYPLPMFMNSVPSRMGFVRKASDYPSGGPVPEVQKIWRAIAPHIDFYGPDIYSPNYQEITDSYASMGPLVVPELSADKDCAAKALFTAAAYNTVLFSPFGIEELARPLPENDYLAMTNLDHGFPSPSGVQALSEAYKLLILQWKDILCARSENRIIAFIDQGAPGREFVMDGYEVVVTYHGLKYVPGEPPSGFAGRKEDAPIGAGFVIKSGDTFRICAVSCNVEIKAAPESGEQTFILDKKEMIPNGDGFRAGRTLNGDERNYCAFGSVPAVQEISFYKRKI